MKPSDKPKPAWRKLLYEPRPPSVNLSEMDPEDVEANEEARLARGLAYIEEKSGSEES